MKKIWHKPTELPKDNSYIVCIGEDGIVHQFYYWYATKNFIKSFFKNCANYKNKDCIVTRWAYLEDIFNVDSIIESMLENKGV